MKPLASAVVSLINQLNMFIAGCVRIFISHCQFAHLTWRPQVLVNTCRGQPSSGSDATVLLTEYILPFLRDRANEIDNWGWREQSPFIEYPSRFAGGIFSEDTLRPSESTRTDHTQLECTVTK